MSRLRALLREPSEAPRRIVSKLKTMVRRRDAAVDTSASDRFAAPIAPVAPSEPPGPTLVVLNDSRDLVNYGSQSNVDGLISILADRLPSATMLPIPSHWLIDTAYGLSAFEDDGAGMRQPQARYPRIADEFEAVADDWMRGKGGPGARQFLSRFENADLVVVNGEGSVYRTNLSAIRELFLAWLAKERLGVPTMFVNGTVQLTDVVPVLPAMVRKTFSILDAVTVREPRSFRSLREYAPDVEAQMVPDTAFVFAPEDARDTAVVQAIRDEIGDAPYFCFDPGPMPMETRGGARAALHQMIAVLEGVAPRSVFVASAPHDRWIEDVARETGSVYVDIDRLTDYREYMAVVAGAQFCASGRYHNTILAGIVGCPTITFASTSHKVHGACELLEGLVGSPYDATHLRPQLDAIEQQARAFVRDRDHLGARLQEVCARRRAETSELGRLAASALAGAGSRVR